jgi:hypothetical protein
VGCRPAKGFLLWNAATSSPRRGRMSPSTQFGPRVTTGLSTPSISAKCGRHPGLGRKLVADTAPALRPVARLGHDPLPRSAHRAIRFARRPVGVSLAALLSLTRAKTHAASGPCPARALTVISRRLGCLFCAVKPERRAQRLCRRGLGLRVVLHIQELVLAGPLPSHRNGSRENREKCED